MRTCVRRKCSRPRETETEREGREDGKDRERDEEDFVIIVVVVVGNGGNECTGRDLDNRGALPFSRHSSKSTQVWVDCTVQQATRVYIQRTGCGTKGCGLFHDEKKLRAAGEESRRPISNLRIPKTKYDFLKVSIDH
ncbi:uncharacterized protein LOC113562489 [Ooceraea biroi]|uniref:uncharacterized protein LOC113562489 n=1 Tax=Ooceraea biroi TaxID=2015173 RepID=UPI000F079161|nr:uncharacterized protein LOC113562489 [Ooceraea biroi]